KSTAEMYAAMTHPKWAEACENTLRIAEMCNVELPFGKNHAPVVKIGKRPGGVGENNNPSDKSVAISKSDRSASSSATNTPRTDSAASPQEPTPGAPLPIGSTEWYKQFCGQFELWPLDGLNAKDITAGELKSRCDSALRELTEVGAIGRHRE